MGAQRLQALPPPVLEESSGSVPTFDAGREESPDMIRPGTFRSSPTVVDDIEEDRGSPPPSQLHSTITDCRKRKSRERVPKSTLRTSAMRKAHGWMRSPAPGWKILMGRFRLLSRR